jgi:serine/threonine-protein kinase
MHQRSAAEITTVDLSGSRTGNSYLLIEIVGGGATGQVWRAVDRVTGEAVAVKLLRRELMTEPKAVTRFVQERSILLMLRHPHIVGVRDLLTIGESLGLVMDLVPGGSLRAYLRDRTTLPAEVAAGLLAQVAEALAEAHRLGVVHRDLKPDNVLVEPGADAPIPHVRLTDFGIARLLDSPGVTTPQALVGTPNYLAPEVIEGAEPSPAVDVYAFGVLLYELLLGRPPYGGAPPVVVLRRHVEYAPQRFPGVPDEAWRVVVACMDHDPLRRPTADDLVTTMRSLARLAAGEPAAAPAPETALWTAAPAAEAAPGAAPIPDARATGGSAAGRPATGGRRPGGPRPGRAVRPGSRRPRRWRAAVTVSAAATVVAALVAVAGAAGLPGMPRIPGLPAALPPAPATALAEPTAPADRTARPEPAPGPAATTPPPAPGGGPGAPTLESAPAPVRQTARRHRAIPPVRVEAGAYGPRSCTTEYQWDVGHPVVAQPCHATGPAIELFGRLQALPGVQADVYLSLQEVDSGRTVAGPFTCAGMMFTDFARRHDCGPFHAEDVRHGRRYAVVQRWSYTGRAVLPSGTARSDPFHW